MTEELRRIVDKGWIARFWEWIDTRRIDMHLVLLVSLALTWRVVEWSMDFADAHPDMDGTRMAAVIGAVLAPWALLQGAMFKFYTDRKSVV